jgi:hypothetical protein
MVNYIEQNEQQFRMHKLRTRKYKTTKQQDIQVINSTINMYYSTGETVRKSDSEQVLTNYVHNILSTLNIFG